MKYSEGIFESRRNRISFPAYEHLKNVYFL